MFKLATSGGAKALGLDTSVGTLEAGKQADLIAVPLPEKNTGDLYSDLLRETKSCIMNMVGGKILYRKGQGSGAGVQSNGSYSAVRILQSACKQNEHR
jgi:cytosine/adenosine deaminase-related metal-dependent hydrolase